MDKISELTINWNRCIYITGEINDEMVSELTPKILALRQESSEAITVAINSYGGSLASTEVLIGLLTGPNQDNVRCSIITVATNKAYSAAANLLAYGDYAVALEHSDVLFHDVRFAGMRDVTPDKALNAAKVLRSENEGFSLRLANHVFKRLMWNFIDLQHEFSDINLNHTQKVAEYKNQLDACGLNEVSSLKFDPAMYGVAMYIHLSRANGALIDRSFEHLGRWGAVMKVAELTPMYKTDGENVGLMDGALELFKGLNRDKTASVNFGHEKNENDLQLFLTLTLARLAGNSTQGFERVLEESIRDFRLIDSLNDPKHKTTARRFMKLHKSIFFSSEAAAILAGEDSIAQEKIFDEAAPVVAFMWQFCILLCRELFNGEHSLSPIEALILGLVDEVPGITFLGSVRKYYVDARLMQDTGISANSSTD